MRLAVSLGDFWDEGPREMLVGVLCGVGVTSALGMLAHRHIVKPLRGIHAHARHQTMLAEELHHLQHTGEPHPRVSARLSAGQNGTPTLR